MPGRLPQIALWTVMSLIATPLALAATPAPANPLLAPWSGPYGGVPPFDKVRVAAAAMLVVAGALFVRAQTRLDRSMAYENAVEVEGLESALAQREPLSQEQATLRKLTGHQ